MPQTNTELHGIRREIRAGSVSDGRQEDAFATELHGIRREKTLSVIFANAEIHTNSKARMDPRIREGDQGANKKGIKAFLLRRREGRKGRQKIQTCLLLLAFLASLR